MRIILAAIYPYAFLLLYLIIPFDNYIRALPNILMAILVIAFPFIVKKEDFKKLKTLPFLLFLLLFLYLFGDAFFSGRLAEDFNIIKKVLIAVGLVILYIPISDLKKINTAIIFSSLSAIIFSVYHFVLITDAVGNFALGDSPQVIESLLIDRLYLGLLSILSILISFQAIKREYHPNNNYYLANIIINIIFIVLIASKIAAGVLIVLVLLKLFYEKRKWPKAVASIIVLAAIIGSFFILKHERTNPFTTNVNEKEAPGFIENSMTWELRSVVWRCSQKIMQEESFILTGLGFDGSKEKLVSCYASQIVDKDKRENFIMERYNTHNQFFDFYLSAGFIALLLFLIFIVVSLFSVRRRFFPTAMLAILIMYCLVENVFYRQIGAYYVGFLLIAFLTIDKATENINAKAK